MFQSLWLQKPKSWYHLFSTYFKSKISTIKQYV